MQSFVGNRSDITFSLENSRQKYETHRKYEESLPYDPTIPKPIELINEISSCKISKNSSESTISEKSSTGRNTFLCF